MGLYDVPGDKTILKMTIKKRDILYPLRRMHGCIFEMQKRKKAAKELNIRFSKLNEKTIFFVLSPTHGNMGDHAIAEAVTKMLVDLKMDYVEVTTAQLSLLRKYGYLSVFNNHLVLVNGGGNLGTLWPEVERLFRNLIQKNMKASIICLPNTIYYENTKKGKKELAKSVKIYNAHPRLILCAREKTSYNLMQQIYNKVLLIPDMALSLNYCKREQLRNGCMLCLRSDREKTITTEDEKELIKTVESLFGKTYRYSDMNIGISVPLENREDALQKKYDEFCSAKLVVTDRLHGMIFATITGTPCIVINSKSPKVKGCYEWVQNLEYVEFAQTIDQIPLLYRRMQQKKYQYDNKELLPFYEQLKQTIIHEVEEICICQK